MKSCFEILVWGRLLCSNDFESTASSCRVTIEVVRGGPTPSTFTLLLVQISPKRILRLVLYFWKNKNKIQKMNLRLGRDSPKPSSPQTYFVGFLFFLIFEFLKAFCRWMSHILLRWKGFGISHFCSPYISVLLLKCTGAIFLLIYLFTKWAPTNKPLSLNRHTNQATFFHTSSHGSMQWQCQGTLSNDESLFLWKLQNKQKRTKEEQKMKIFPYWNTFKKLYGAD